MRKLANLFFILFVLSAISGLLSELLPAVAISHSLHQFLWFACLIAGALAYIGFGFNRHLPVAVLMLPMLWLAWSLMAWWPLDLTAISWGRAAAFVGQLLVAMIVLKMNALANGRSLLLTPSQFTGSGFSLRRFILFSCGSLIIVPVTAVVILFSTAGQLLHTSSGGFVSLRPDGLYMAEKVYHRGDKQIRLTGMIHLGQRSYYNDLITSIPAGKTLILAEGVSDEAGLMRHTFDYHRVAELFGLISQEQFPFAGRLIDKDDLTKPYVEGFDGPHILPADIDLQQFDPRTVEVLNALARYVLNAESLVSGYREFNRWVQENMTADINRVVMNDLIDKRNRALLEIIPAALERYDRLVIPWGALHMKGIEEEIKEIGFYLTESTSSRSINFLNLDLSQLASQLKNDN